MTQKQIKVTVPAKIHLMGEHAIVYGKPAIITAINIRLSVFVSDAKEFSIETNENSKLINKAVEIVNAKLGFSLLPKVKITVGSQIPPGHHLGSSAAVSVGVVSALYYYLKKVWNLQLFNELAYNIEKFQHGNPSGGDNTAVTYGGLIWYRKEMEFLKSIWQLPFKVSGKLSPFVLANTGRPKESTGDMVSLVSRFVKRYPLKSDKLLTENENAVKKITLAVKEGDEKLLIQAIKEGEKTLEKLGVVSRQVIPFIREMERLGGAAKILGGGGKSGPVGFLLCYQPDNAFLTQISRKYNYPLVKIELGEEGVRLESR